MQDGVAENFTAGMIEDYLDAVSYTHLLNGKPASPEMTIAAEPGLFGALSEFLAALDPERDAPG